MKVQDQMASQVNSTTDLEESKSISHSNAFRKLKKKTNDLTHSVRPTSLQYQNQTIMSQEKKTIGKVIDEHRCKTLK